MPKMTEETTVADACGEIVAYVRDSMGSPNPAATAQLLLIAAAATCKNYDTWQAACAMAWTNTHHDCVN